MQAYLEIALRTAARAADRIEVVDDDEGIQCVLNSHVSQNGMLFGQMIRFQPGRDQTVVVLNAAAGEFPVEQFPLAAREDGHTHEVVESVLYFGVLENHVVVSQSHALKIRDLEQHLQWLIGEKVTPLPTDYMLLLTDRVSADVRARVERQRVKKVSLGVGLHAVREREAAGVNLRHLRFSPLGKGFDILESLLGSRWRNELQLADSLDEANLRVRLEVTYNGRQSNIEGHEILDNISAALRHAEEGDVMVELKGGDIITGDSLKMKGYVNVTVNNQIVESFSMYQAMRQWLVDRIAAQTLE